MKTNDFGVDNVCRMPSKEQALNIYVASVAIFLVNYFIRKRFGA